MKTAVLCIATCIALTACSKAPESPPPRSSETATKPAAAAAAPAAVPVAAAHAEDADVAWQKGDVDAAFAAAKAEGKPVFLYWGAVWCPPCNQVKATIFNRRDFIERSRFFVPVYIDGDSPARRNSARASRSPAIRR